MKRRHVQAIAIATLVFVTLTGARRSGGGGCDDNSSGSSGGTTTGGDYGTSSTGGHGDDYDFTSGGTTSSGVTSGGTTSGGTTTSGRSTGGNNTPDANQSLRVTSCEYNQTTQKFTSTIQVRNDSQRALNYLITVKVVQTSGSNTGQTLGTDLVNIDNVAPGQTRTATAETFNVPVTEQITFECKANATSLPAN